MIGELRYLPWMIRDLARTLGIVTLVLAALSWVVVQQANQVVAAPPVDQLAVVVEGWMLILVLVASAGIVCTDRSRGYYRFLFAFPINPVRYYLVRWLVGAAALAVAVAVLSVPVDLHHKTLVWSWSALARIELMYLLLGGLVFALSTALPRDWLPALLLYILVSLLDSLVRFGGSDFPKLLLSALPPFHAFGRTGLPGGKDLAHIIGYGVGLVALALSVLWARPLGAGSRE